MPVIGLIRDAKEIGAGIGSILKRSKAKRQEKKAAKAEAAAQAAMLRSQQLAARAGFGGGSILEAKVSAAPVADGGAVEEKMARFVADVKQGFNLMEWVRKNIAAVAIGAAALFALVFFLRGKRKRR
jgi:hypothetical protein